METDGRLACGSLSAGIAAEGIACSFGSAVDHTNGEKQVKKSTEVLAILQRVIVTPKDVRRNEDGRR